MKVGNKASTSVDATIGARIRARRRQCGISQTVLARSLGVTFQQVQKYEKGTNRVVAGRLSTIATQLQVPLSFFFDEQHAADQINPSHAQEGFEGLCEPELAELNTAFQKIKGRGRRRAIIKLIKTIADERNGHP